MSRRYVPWLAHAAVWLFFGLFFFLPICRVLRGALFASDGAFTLVYLGEVFRNPLYISGLRNSFLLAVCTTSVAMVVAVPLAWLSDKYEFAGKRLLSGALLLPLILPPFVGAVGMQRVFGRYGALSSLLTSIGLLDPAGGGVDWLGTGFPGIVVIEALHLYPILYLNAVAAFANVDPMLYDAAADSGCVGFSRFRRVTLPLVAPGVFAGGILVFIWSFTELGTPLMFHFGRVTPVQIFDGLHDIGSSAMPYALVLVMMAASALLFLLARFLFGRRSYAMISKAGAAGSRGRPTGAASWLVPGAFGLAVAVGILPHLGVIGMAVGESWHRTVLPTGLTLQHIDGALGHNLTVPSILNSVRYAAGAVVLAMIIGVFIAHVVVRGRGRLRWLIDVLAMLPLAVPGLVLAFGYLALSRKGGLFHAVDPIRNPTVLLIVAYAVRRLPYVVRSAVAGLQQTSATFEEAAKDLGASPATTFRRITMPLISANLIAGGVLAFSFSMLEVSDSLILAQRTLFFPITKAMYELSMLLGEGQSVAAALGLWTMLFLGASLVVASLLLGRRLGALFRVG